MPPKASRIHINLRLCYTELLRNTVRNSTVVYVPWICDRYSARKPLAPLCTKNLECFYAEVHVSVSRDRGPARRAAADRERLFPVVRGSRVHVERCRICTCVYAGPV